MRYVVAAALAVLASQAAYGQPTNITTLSVVLLTFPDALPHGYTRTGTTLTPGSNSYTIDDWERKFGASGSFRDMNGVPITVGSNEALLPSYGSVKDYFHELSGGELDFNVRLVNREDPSRPGYPQWIVMDSDHSDYLGQTVGASSFLHHGLITARRYIRNEYTADEQANDFADFSNSQFLRTADVVAFVYSGWQDENRTGLHPHARRGGSVYVTGEREGDGNGPDDHDNNPATPAIQDAAETFGAIGIHAHEIGHILGFRHPQANPGNPDYVTTDDWNPYANQRPGVTRYDTTDDEGNPITEVVENWGGGSVAGWCTMHQGSDGPATEGSHRGDGAFTFTYASCPNPYNAFYMMDLRTNFSWNIDVHSKNSTEQHARIDPAPEHYYLIDAPGGELMLEFRDADSFGKYNQWYQFDEAPGLLVWRRNRVNLADPSRAPLPRIIPADNRRIFNALAQPVSGETTRLWNDSFVYPWIDIISDPFGAVQEVSTGENLVEANGLRSTIESMASYQGEDPAAVANRDALPDYMQLVGPAPGRNWPAHRVTPDWATDESHFAQPPSRTDANGNEVGDDDPLHVALRNIVVNRGTDPHALVNIFHGYWEGTLTQSASWSGDVYVGGDLIVPEGITLTIGNGTTVHFLKPRASDVNSNEIAEIVVRDRGTLDIGTDVTFTSAHERKNQFDVAADDQENEDHGLIVEGRGIVTIEGLTFYDGTHTLSGPVTVGGDLIVGDGTNAATLRLEAGTEVRFAATDAESDGQDPGRVELIVENSGVLQAGAGNITFRSSNDPDDATNTDWYGIRVAASGIADLSGATIRDGSRCLQLRGASTVTLTNTTLTNCGLTVALTGIPPVLGGRITASLDPGDGSTLNEEFWQWQGRAGATDDWESLRPSTGRRYPAEGTYIPRDGVRGHMLRATLRYRARFGGGSSVYNYAQSAPTAAVAPGSPDPLSNCTPSEGDRRVTIACDPAEANGSPLLRNEYRQSTDEGVTWDPNRWVEIPLGTNPNTMSVDVSNLRNGTEYTFELRAVNAVGPGASVRVEATPGAGPGVPPQPTSGLTARPGGGTGINVGWGAVEATPAVTGYRVRSQWALVGTSSWSSYDTVATPGARTLRYPHRDYTNVVVKHRLRYQVQAVNASGAGAWSAAFPAGGLVPPPSGPPGLESMGVDARAVTMTWECPNNRWCEPLPGSTVAPMTLEAQGKTGGRAWGDDWEAVPTAQLTSVTHLVAALGRDQVHQFRTRAVNSEGAEGFASSAGAALPLRAEAGDGQVALSWDSPGYSRLSWQSRSKAGAGSWTSWQSVPASEASTTSYNSSPMPGRRPPAATCGHLLALEPALWTFARRPAWSRRTTRPTSPSPRRAVAPHQLRQPQCRRQSLPHQPGD